MALLGVASVIFSDVVFVHRLLRMIYIVWPLYKHFWQYAARFEVVAVCPTSFFFVGDLQVSDNVLRTLFVYSTMSEPTFVALGRWTTVESACHRSGKGTTT